VEFVYVFISAVLVFLAGFAAGWPSANDCTGKHTWGKWEEIQTVSYYSTEIRIKRNCKVCGEIQIERRVLD